MQIGLVPLIFGVTGVLSTCIISGSEELEVQPFCVTVTVYEVPSNAFTAANVGFCVLAMAGVIPGPDHV